MVVDFSCGWDAKDENDEETFGLVRLMAGLADGGGAEFHFILLPNFNLTLSFSSYNQGRDGNGHKGGGNKRHLYINETPKTGRISPHSVQNWI